MPIRKSQTRISLVAGLMAFTIGTQFISGPFQAMPGPLLIETPEPNVLLATANEVAANWGWAERAQIETEGELKYARLIHEETDGDCTYGFYVQVGPGQDVAPDWFPGDTRYSLIDFHGYEATHFMHPQGSSDYIVWQAHVWLGAAKTATWDCIRPVDAMPLAEALYAAAARNGLLEDSSHPTQTATPMIAQPTPTPEPITVSVSVENNYTAIASDGKSELIIQAAVTGPVSGEDVVWSARKLDTSEDITSQLTKHATDAYNALRIFKPAEIYDKPFEVEIRATVKTAQDEISASMQIQVVRPPVILVHGIWSDSSAMLPLETILLSDAMFGTRLSIVNYSTPTSYGDMTQKVDVLGAEVAEVLASMNGNGTKVSRVDIVAHSMGGLITRLYLINNASNVRKLITLATPHNGTDFANWYHELVENGLQDCSGNPAQYTDQLPTTGELDWFLKVLRNNQKLRADALQYGEAVRQLQTTDIDDSIPHLLSYSQPGSVEYYFLAGDEPFLSRESADRAAGFIRWIFPAEVNPQKPGDCEQTTLSPGFDTMITEFFKNISAANTDGVVPLESARGKGLSARQVATVHATHFSIVGNPDTINAVLRYLTDGKARLSGTVMNSNSPGHLHVYDDRGNHVGLDATGNAEIGIEGASYQPFANATGDHESIWLPPGVEGLRLEFVADEEGTVGLEIGQGMEDGLHFFSYEEVEVQPGSTVAIQVHPTDPEGQITHPDGETISLSPTFSQIGDSSEGSGVSSDESSSPARSKLRVSNAGLMCACAQGWVLVAGGLLGVVVLRRRQAENKKPILILGIAALVLTIATCLLGASLISDRSSDEATSQATATIKPSPRMEIPANSPTPSSTATPESPRTSMAELTLINDTGTDVCYVLISSVENEDWGEDWLGSDEVLSPGDSRTFQVPVGTYDLAAADCEKNFLTEQHAVDISGMMEWIIEE
jgi:pimeloyl-ACP methyl ester carboxylesterase